MSLFVISDLHLPGGARINKSMELFGDRWHDHKNRLERAWRQIISDDDTVIINGDITWAMTTSDAEDDFRFIDSLPGHKLIGKGNHDYFWTTVGKMKSFLSEKQIDSIDFLYNNAFMCENFIICGTRGWFSDEKLQKPSCTADFEKIVLREAGRLEMSIKDGMELSGGDSGRIRVFLHFPAVLNGVEITEITDVLKKYGIGDVYFGHVHGFYSYPRTFEHDGIRYHASAADYLGFTPRLVT